MEIWRQLMRKLVLFSKLSNKVSLEPVCGFCKGDIAAMADKAGLKSLTIVEEKTNTILYWQPGMKSIKEKN
jgi:hypothetical protein